MSGNALLERIDAYAQAIRERRPLTTDEVKELDAYFRIGMTYTSNALEGNSLTLSETKVLLEDGITVGGKPIRDCYEATGHARAYDYMLETARGGPLQFREEDILRLHALFYGGIDPEHAGRYREGQVFITGTEYVPPTAEEVPGLMAGLVEELNKRRDAMHPVLLAAYAHRRLVDIHPFQDGNGRTARLLMNQMRAQGARPADLIAKIAGGARMFGPSSGKMDIGQQNVEAVRKSLAQEGIRLVAQHTGRNYGRTILFYAENGRLEVNTVRHSAIVL